VQPGQLDPGLIPKLGVQVGERLIEQKSLRFPNDGPAHGHALPLAAGELTRRALQKFLEAENLGDLRDSLGDRPPSDAPQLEAERKIVSNGFVRVQGVALKDHCQIALLGRELCDLSIVKQDPTTGRRFQSRHDPQ
jgi:hypothetical protein